MTNSEITTYLNDHLAGSVAALELIEQLIKRHSGKPLGSFLVDLEREIKADQDVLRKLLGDGKRKESGFRKLAAWVASKFVGSKFKFASEEFGGLGLVQGLEMLALGIRGKELLWRALAASEFGASQQIDLAGLEQRAIEQQERVEAKRLEAVRAVFG